VSQRARVTVVQHRKREPAQRRSDNESERIYVSNEQTAPKQRAAQPMQAGLRESKPGAQIGK
jgi:hypothetical protein